MGTTDTSCRKTPFLTFQTCDFPLQLQLFLSNLQHAFLDGILTDEADDLYRPGKKRTPFKGQSTMVCREDMPSFKVWQTLIYRDDVKYKYNTFNAPIYQSIVSDALLPQGAHPEVWPQQKSLNFSLFWHFLFVQALPAHISLMYAFNLSSHLPNGLSLLYGPLILLI